jgi:hypothetical protein
MMRGIITVRRKNPGIPSVAEFDLVQQDNVLTASKLDPRNYRLKASA